MPHAKSPAEVSHPVLAVGDDGEWSTKVPPCRGLKQRVEARKPYVSNAWIIAQIQSFNTRWIRSQGLGNDTTMLIVQAETG